MKQVDGYDELEKIDIPKIYSGKIIKGIEVKSGYVGRNIDILGYHIDPEKMNNWIEEFYKINTREKLQVEIFHTIYDAAKSMGMKLDDKQNIVWDPSHDWSSYTIFSHIMKYEENKKILPEDAWNNFNIFNKKYCADPNDPLYVDKSKGRPTIKETIKAIHNAGGLSFIAHPFIYEWAEDKKRFIGDLIKNYEFDGIECYHSQLSEEESEYLVSLCKEKNYTEVEEAIIMVKISQN